LFAVSPAWADGPGPDDPRYGTRPAILAPKPGQEAFVKGQTGQFNLAGGEIRLTVPQGYLFYPASEAKAHLQRIGAPAPNGEVLGMVALAQGPRPVDDNFWGAIISFEPIGYVAEERANRFVSADFLQEVQAARGNAQGRQLQAFALPPAHDPNRHIVSWTEQYPATTQTARALRNEQRLLGRRGVAGTTVVARPDQMPTVNAAAPYMLNMIAFAPDRTYSSYKPSADPAAIYDLPGVISRKPKPTGAAATAAAAPPPTATPAAPATQQSALAPTTQPSTLSPSSAQAEENGDALAPLLRWMPWVGGGLLLLALVPLLVGRFRGGRSEKTRIVEEHKAPAAETKSDPNLTPTD
jgi:uncharacterized membrane-anchored protein